MQDFTSDDIKEFNENALRKFIKLHSREEYEKFITKNLFEKIIFIIEYPLRLGM